MFILTEIIYNLSGKFRKMFKIKLKLRMLIIILRDIINFKCKINIIREIEK